MPQPSSHHGSYTFTTMSKNLKINLSIPFICLFYKTFHFYIELLSSEGVFKGPKHPLIYQKKKKKQNNFFFNTSHGSPCDLTCTFICSMTFLMSQHL